MITITKTLEPFDTFHDFYSFDPQKCLFFDIETTGLSAASSIVFLIGIIRFNGTHWQLTQWLADSIADEADILKTFFDTIGDSQILIHFNGTTFDIPFITERAEHHHISHTLREKTSLDLYQRFRPIRKLFNLERMNQTSLESFLGWQREDRLSGKHMISLFAKYTASGENGLRNLLLLHNHDDMIGMTKLLPLTSYLMLLQGNIRTAQAVLASDTLTITFELCSPLPVPYHSDLSLNAKETISFHAENDHGTLHIPLFRGELRYFFPDYKNYYYLPLEDQAVHKSIGAYVDREHRTAAKPATCYTRKSSVFLPQPERILAPSFRKCYEDRLEYFEFSEDVAAAFFPKVTAPDTDTSVLEKKTPDTDECLMQYAASLLRALL